MLENVGKEFLDTYWKIVDWALKSQTGAGVIQVITIPEASTYEPLFSLPFSACSRLLKDGANTIKRSTSSKNGFVHPLEAMSLNSVANASLLVLVVRVCLQVCFF